MASAIGAGLLAACIALVSLSSWTSGIDHAPIKVYLQQPRPNVTKKRLEAPIEAQTPILDETTEPEVEQKIKPTSVEPDATSVDTLEPNPDVVTGPPRFVDWYAAMEKHTSKNPLSTGHLSPLAAAKAAAQKRFAPVEERRQIWDYIEKDPYGRTLLRSGDCFRVLDDPHLPTIDIFENFTRFLVFCQNKDRSEISLDGLDEILKRYKHLQPPQ